MVWNMKELNDQSEKVSSTARSIRPARLGAHRRAIPKVRAAVASKASSGTIAGRLDMG